MDWHRVLWIAVFAWVVLNHPSCEQTCRPLIISTCEG